jgi:hypothetical protein
MKRAMGWVVAAAWLSAGGAWAQSADQAERIKNGDRVRFSPGGTGSGGAARGDAAPISTGRNPYENSGCNRIELRKTILAHQSEVRDCYQARINEKPDVAGEIHVEIVVGQGGKVASATPTKSTLNDDKLQACVLGRILRWEFPAPKGAASCSITFPWVFKPLGTQPAPQTADPKKLESGGVSAPKPLE